MRVIIPILKKRKGKSCNSYKVRFFDAQKQGPYLPRNRGMKFFKYFCKSSGP
jgi:hypothetical protein